MWVQLAFVKGVTIETLFHDSATEIVEEESCKHLPRVLSFHVFVHEDLPDPLSLGRQFDVMHITHYELRNLCKQMDVTHFVFHGVFEQLILTLHWLFTTGSQYI